MSGKVDFRSVALLLPFAFADCDRVDQADRGRAAARATAPAKESKPLPQQLSKEAAVEHSTVTRLRVPNGGIQPQALIDPTGTLHLIYFKGEKANAGDLLYVRRDTGKEGFSKPIRINSRPNTACAMGSVRGGQIALGKGGRLHVVWNGIGTDYARLNDSGTAFEEQRNLMRKTYVPDGGGTVAADDAGNVYVVWHGQLKGDKGEDKRKVWLARSADDGKTFSMEAPVWTKPTGVCPCCSTRAFADRKGSVYLLYRSATAAVNRDIYVLASADQGKSFDRFTSPSAKRKTSEFTEPQAVSGPGRERKHPAVAVTARGEILLAWTEGTGWERGGALAWQVFDSSGKPTSERRRVDGGIPVWGLPTVVATAAGFTIIH
jgi:hypothetical protein